MIVECHKCGAKNSIPDLSEPGKSYHCGKCKTRLTLTPKAPDAQDERSAILQVDRTDYLEHVEVREPAAPKPLLTTAVS